MHTHTLQKSYQINKIYITSSTICQFCQLLRNDLSTLKFNNYIYKHRQYRHINELTHGSHKTTDIVSIFVIIEK